MRCSSSRFQLRCRGYRSGRIEGAVLDELNQSTKTSTSVRFEMFSVVVVAMDVSSNNYLVLLFGVSQGEKDRKVRPKSTNDSIGRASAKMRGSSKSIKLLPCLTVRVQDTTGLCARCGWDSTSMLDLQHEKSNPSYRSIRPRLPRFGRMDTNSSCSELLVERAS